MTIQQLQYALEIQRTGSISQAARNLFLSQPNISNALKKLEAELEFDIFERTSGGMRPTTQGRLFLQRAGHIMQELNSIAAEARQEPTIDFRMLYVNYLPMFDAFVQLCRAHQNSSKLSMYCYTLSDPDSLKEMISGSYDICLTGTGRDDSHMRRRCAAYRIGYLPLIEAPYYVQLSKTHPLLQGDTFLFERLHDYPYVDFCTPDATAGVTSMLTEFVDPERIIRVQSVTARRDIVAQTNAFSIVMPHAAAYNEAHGLVNIRIPGHTFHMCCLYPLERGLSPLANEYLSYLNGIMEEIRRDNRF